MMELIPYINLLNLSWIKIKSIFEEYGAFKDEKCLSKNVSCGTH